jgi:L-arabinose isomerase
MNKNRRPKAALLPLYLKLYDEVLTEIRPDLEKFLKEVSGFLQEAGIDIILLPICRIKEEFEKAAKSLSHKDVDFLCTLHLAYSPSEESIDALKKIGLPIVVLDTTPKYDFGPNTDPSHIMRNHGIHGVQDMCNLLKREGVKFRIAAGHISDPDYSKKVMYAVNGALMAKSLQTKRVGSIGGFFKGMGDFYLEPKEIEQCLGIKVISARPQDLLSYIPGENDSEVELEKKQITDRFHFKDVKSKSLLNTVRMSLAVRKWIKEQQLNAFTMNFSAIHKSSGFLTLPFYEACRSMSEGIGYAGEGDVITASLVGAVMDVYPDTSFTEIFCPCFKDGLLFLSHMGEINFSVAKDINLIEKDLPFTDLDAPLIPYGRFLEGDAWFINLAPLGNHAFNLIITPVEMVGFEDIKFAQTVRGWMRTKRPLCDFLEQFSVHGGTHHSALVYGCEAEVMDCFADFMGWNLIQI